ncbi:MAG: OmpA family protein [Deltaproteobacteria bacterium]|nr:OmpA family protein [Deltaproteobacteria bacterium]
MPITSDMRHVPIAAAGFLIPLGPLGTGGKVHPPGAASAQVVVAASSDPLILYDASGHVRGGVHKSLQAEGSVSVGIGWNLELVGVLGGEALSGSVDHPDASLPKAKGLSDARLGMRWIGIPGILAIRGDMAPATGEASFDLAVRGRLHRRAVVEALAGIQTEKRQVIYDTVIDDSLVWGGGLDVNLSRSLSALAQVRGEVGLAGADSPAEWGAGLRTSWGPLTVSLLGGTGIGRATGSPAWRVTMAVSFRPSTEVPSPPRRKFLAGADSSRARTDSELELGSPTVEVTPSDIDATGLDLIDAETPNVTVKDSEILLGEPIFFVKNRKRIRNSFRPILDELALFLNKHPEIRKVRIEGHADALGTPEWNAALSRLRADQVVGYLVTSGVARDRLEPVAYGADRPWVSNEEEAERALNRRVVFTVTDAEIGGTLSASPIFHGRSSDVAPSVSSVVPPVGHVETTPPTASEAEQPPGEEP